MASLGAGAHTSWLGVAAVAAMMVLAGCASTSVGATPAADPTVVSTPTNTSAPATASDSPSRPYDGEDLTQALLSANIPGLVVTKPGDATEIMKQQDLVVDALAKADIQPSECLTQAENEVRGIQWGSQVIHATAPSGIYLAVPETETADGTDYIDTAIEQLRTCATYRLNGSTVTTEQVPVQLAHAERAVGFETTTKDLTTFVVVAAKSNSLVSVVSLGGDTPASIQSLDDVLAALPTS